MRPSRSSSVGLSAERDVILLDHGTGSHHRLLQSGHKEVDLIPDLEVCGPAPIRRMTDLLFAPHGVYGPDIRARIEHQSSTDTFTARGGTLPRKRPAPRVREIKAGDVVQATST